CVVDGRCYVTGETWINGCMEERCNHGSIISEPGPGSCYINEICYMNGDTFEDHEVCAIMECFNGQPKVKTNGCRMEGKCRMNNEEWVEKCMKFVCEKGKV
ncbi:unnamed protein product, partial [Meganyctiphanes norvegica]